MSPAAVHRFVHRAMNTVFEIRIASEDGNYAYQASLAAFEVLERLEKELSRFVPTGDPNRIARLEPGKWLPLGMASFECLRVALEVFRETGGALDVTVPPLLAFWKRAGATADVSDVELAAQYGRVGSALLTLDETTRRAAVGVEGVEIDFGAVGKGCAVDEMVEILGAWGVDSALIHGGTSTVYAIGDAPGRSGWPIRLRNPDESRPPLEEWSLSGFACAGSGALEDGAEGEAAPHIVDPRTGRMARRRPASWALAPTALLADALSTAFLVLDREEIAEYCRRRPEASAIIVDVDNGAYVVTRIGEYFSGKDVSDV